MVTSSSFKRLLANANVYVVNDFQRINLKLVFITDAEFTTCRYIDNIEIACEAASCDSVQTHVSSAEIHPSKHFSVFEYFISLLFVEVETDEREDNRHMLLCILFAVHSSSAN